MKVISFQEWDGQFEIRSGDVDWQQIEEDKDGLTFYDNGSVKDAEGNFIVKCDSVRRRAAK